MIVIPQIQVICTDGWEQGLRLKKIYLDTFKIWTQYFIFSHLHYNLQ